VICQQKAQRARRLGAESQIIKTISTRSSAESRPPVRGCAGESPFIICLKESADHSSIVVLTSIFINRIEWDTPKGAEVDLYLRQQWEDSRLAYDVDPREDVSEITLPDSTEIWVPDTYISSGREKEVDESRRRLIVEPSGHVRSSEERVVMVSPSTSSSSPFSPTRTLTLRLSSYKYPIEDIVYLWANSPPLVAPVEVSPSLLSGSLQFEHAVAGDCVGNYSIGVYSCIDVVVTFKTSFSTSFCRFFLPSALLVIFSFLHMWLHASWSVPRSFSAVLPFVIFALIFLFTTPKPHESCWLCFCLLITFFSLVEYFVVICCGVRRTSHLPTYTDEAGHKATQVTNAIGDATNTSCTAALSPLDAIGRVAFPLVFIIFTILFAFLF
ncbi:hypothetical protein PFISCL1PPCAC_6355, partial [Pristionchus fissidentatus]